MKYLITILMFASTLLLSMDLSKQLKEIISHGTLSDFQSYEPVFRADLDANALLVAQQSYCDPRLYAIKKVRMMHNNPIVKQLVDTMQQRIELLPKDNYHRVRDAYFREIEASCVQEGKKIAFNKALKVINILLWGHASFAGVSIKDMNAKLEHEPDPEKYLNDEQQKLIIIKDSIQNILDTEFEPQPELEYDAECDVYFCRHRERKQN